MTLVTAIAIFMLLALIAYCLSGGADFGGGLWDLLARGRSAERQRRLIADAIAPIWEANHVWLIVIVTLLFICFPKAFAMISIALHIPLTLMLVGIVLRGAAFTFRSYGNPDQPRARRWELLFAITSTLTPIMLGITLAALATGRVMLPSPEKDFFHNYVGTWLAPFPVTIGCFTLSLFALLSAVYLILETEVAELREVFRRKALGAALVVGLFALVSYWISGHEAPVIERDLSDRWWSLPLQALTGCSAVATIVGLWMRRYRATRVFVILQVTLIVCGWAFSQYPYLVYPQLLLKDAAASPPMLRAILIALLLGTVILIPSFFYLFRVFKREKAGKNADASREIN